MHRFIHLTTASAMLLHALMGCCMHHDHGGEGVAHGGEGVAAPLSLTVATHAPSACGHTHHRPAAERVDPAAFHASETTPIQDEGSHDCDDEPCVVVLSDHASVAIDVDLVGVALDRLIRLQPATGVSVTLAFRDSPPRRTVRLQSDYCVWLI